MACMIYFRAVMLLATPPCDPSSAVLAILLTADVACRETALEIASALAYLHSLNILHGDLSGGNILLTSSNKDTRKFTCKVPLPSSNATSGRAALCAMMLRVLDCRCKLVRLQKQHSTVDVAKGCIKSPDTAHLRACTCRYSVLPGIFGSPLPMSSKLLTTAPLGRC